VITVAEALLLVLWSAIGQFLLGGILASAGPVGLTSAEVLFTGLPAIAAARWRGGLPAIGIVRPRARTVAGAALVGATAWAFLGSVVLPLQEKLIPTPQALEEALRRAAAPNLAALVAVSVVPAICEELLFRGVLAPALDRRFGRVFAVVGSALVFAMCHGALARFAPTFLLGCSYAAIALAARTTVPTMVAHALNNGAVWLFAASPPLQESFDAHLGLVAGMSAVALAAGHTLVFIRFPSTR